MGKILMNMKWIFFFCLVLLQSCFMYDGKKLLTMERTVKEKKDLSASVTRLNVGSDKITITGTGLNQVSIVKIEKDSFSEELEVISVSDTQVIASAKKAFSLALNQAFNLIIATAEAQVSFPITFTLQDGAVTASKLSDMGASNGQVLKYSNGVWTPTDLVSSQVFMGTWDAGANNPLLAHGGCASGEYYIVATAGNVFINNSQVGDWVMCNSSHNWERIDNTSNAVSSFNTRHGAVTLAPSDYIYLKDTNTHKITGSKLTDIADVDTTGIASGKVLKWDGAKWVVSDDLEGGAANSVGTTQIQDSSVTYAKMNLADGEIPQVKVNGLVASLAAKEPALATDTTAKYYRGDKSWQTLNTTAVTEGTNLYYTDGRAILAPLTGYALGASTTLASTDSVLSAFGKVQGQLDAKAAIASIVDWSTGIGPSFLSDQRTALGIVNTRAGSIAIGDTYQQALEKLQTQSTALSSGTSSNQWTASGSDIYRASGKVGIGTNAPTSSLTVEGDGEFSGKISAASATLGTVRRSLGGGTSTAYLSLIGGGTGTGGYYGGEIDLYGVASGANALNSAILFRTGTGFNNGSQAERMRINSIGNVGMGVSLPTAVLHLKAGTSTTNTAPLKFTTGTNLTTAEAGAVEYDGTNLYFTNDALTRKTLATTDSVSGNYVAKAGDTMTGALGLPSNGLTVGTNELVVTGGNVGIGTTSPSYKLDVSGDIRIASGSSLLFGTTPICTVGGCVSSSDKRLKENILPLKNSFEKILQLEGVEYDWINKKLYGDKKQVGLIAQDLEKVFPQVVNTDPKSGFKTVAYDHLIAPLIEAFKELNNRFMAILKTSDETKERVSKLEAENGALKNKMELQNSIFKQENEKLKKENELIKAKLEKIEKFLEKTK